MTRLAVLGAAGLASVAALAAPTMAQEASYNPAYCAQFYPDANCQNKGPGDPYTGDYQRHLAHDDQLQYRDRAWHRGWRHSWDDER